MAYTLKEKLAKKGTKCRPGIKLDSFLGVTIHNTGNTSKGADALAHANYLRGGGASKSTSWHYAVGEKYAYKSIPESEKAWHAGDGGSGKGNSRTIGIEICMNSDGNLKGATDNAAILTAKILKSKGIKKAVSNSNVFQHNYWTGKNCPQKIRAGKPYSWTEFIKKVNTELDKLNSSSESTASSTASKKRKKAKAYAKKRKTVRNGTKSADAKRLQKLLNKLGFKGANGKKLTVDKKAGTNTIHALATAQRKYGLKVDRICGPASWEEFYYRTL